MEINDLILRAAAIEAFDDERVDRNYGDVSPESVIEVIKSIPAVDAAPVVHGRWVHHRGGFNDHFECTACGEAIVLTCKWRFCPNCGAKMNDERRNNN